MRVLILSHNYAPELTGVGRSTDALTTWLADQGHQMRVITTAPYYPQWRVHDGYRVWQYRRQDWRPGITVWRCPMWVPHRPTGLKRLLHLGSFAISLLPVLIAQRNWRPDLVMTMEPSLFYAPAALVFARFAGSKSWLHILDFEVDAAFGLQMLRWAPLHRAAHRWESWCMQRFDRLSTISRPMLKLAIAKGAPAERTVLLPNWVDLGQIQEDTVASAALRQEWGIAPEQTMVLYSGNLGVKQGIDIILEAARLLAAHPEIQFVVCGAGAMQAEIAATASSCENLQLRGLVPANQLSTLLHAADVHLLPQRSEAADLVMPSKLVYMFASGRPVVATASIETEVGRAVLQAGGIVVPPGDPTAVAQALTSVARERERWRAAGALGRKVAEAEFGRDRITDMLIHHLHELCPHLPSASDTPASAT